MPTWAPALRRGSGRSRGTDPDTAGTLRGNPAPSDGRTRVLDLAPVRDKLGEHWPRYSEAVHLIAEKIVRRELRLNDTHRRVGDTVVIEFNSRSKLQASRTFRKIEADLSELLFGAGGALADPSAPGRWRRTDPASERPKGLLRRVVVTLLAPIRALKRSRPATSGTTDGASAPAAENADGYHAQADSADQTNAPTAPIGTDPAAILNTPVRFAGGARREVGLGVLPTAAPDPTGGPVTFGMAPLSPSFGPSTGGDSSGGPLYGGVAKRREQRRHNEIRNIEAAILDATLRTAREHAKFGPGVEAALRRVRFAYRPLLACRQPRARDLPLHPGDGARVGSP